MATNKVKVFNRGKSDYGFVSISSGFDINIKPGSFAMLTEDDIAYLESICAYNKKPFATKRLEIETSHKDEIEESLGIVKAKEGLVESDDEIIKKLKGSTSSMQKWIDTVKDPVLLYNIIELAKPLDLPASKTRILQEVVPGAEFN